MALILQINSNLCLSLDQKNMCCSPTSNFGNDFNNLVRKALGQQILCENSTNVVEEINMDNQICDENGTKENARIKLKMKKNESKEKQVGGSKENQTEKSIEDSKNTSKIENENQDSDSKKKKKKWKAVPMEQLGFNFSLFPRPVQDNNKINENEKKLNNFIENEIEKIEIMSEPFEKLQDFEGCYSGNIKYLRADRDRKVRKVHKEVKDKYCKNVKNNKGRKTLYIHHRLSKLINMDIQTLSYLPSKHKKKKLKVEKTEMIRPKYSTPAHVAPVAKPQCLAYALDNHNTPSDFDSQVANLLITLQHRDLTPEDYDLLLRLDERVKPKTLNENLLAQFKTDVVENNDECEVCPVCMELYQVGQTRKYLPCNHVFHCDCIDMWLKNSSMNCPIDNLPLEPS